MLYVYGRNYDYNSNNKIVLSANKSGLYFKPLLLTNMSEL